MRFVTEHRFHATPDDVAALLADPDFYAGLVLPDLNLPRLIEHTVDGSSSTMTLRYEFVGHLDPIARRLLGSDRLAWVQEVVVDRSTHSGSLSFGSERDAKRLHGSAKFVLEHHTDITSRRLEGEVVVAVPGIGRSAERRIVPGLVRRLDLEAEAIEEKLLHGS